MSKSDREKKVHFLAGPAKIPDEVMEEAHREFLNYKNLDLGVAEMSHRSKEFEAIITEAESNLRNLLKVPDEYAILYMHGGAKTQFSLVPMNLCPELNKYSLDYIVNGSWSKMAVDDAKAYAANVGVQLLKSEKFNRLPTKAELIDPEDAHYRYYCDNETIEGVEFNYVPEYRESKVDLICDMTSNFLTRPIDVSKFGVIFAGCQKNSGLSGLVTVLVRKDLIGKHMSVTPKTLRYKTMLDSRSLYNTPLTFAIYMANLCYKWVLNNGGLEAMDQFCKRKSGLLYDFIDSSGGFYTCPVEKSSRSRVNVVFLLADKDLDKKFLSEAKEANLFGLEGHRTVGGFRASLYHGITEDNVKRLVDFMRDFQANNS